MSDYARLLFDHGALPDKYRRVISDEINLYTWRTFTLGTRHFRLRLVNPELGIGRTVFLNGFFTYDDKHWAMVECKTQELDVTTSAVGYWSNEGQPHWSVPYMFRYISGKWQVAESGRRHDGAKNLFEIQKLTSDGNWITPTVATL